MIMQSYSYSLDRTCKENRTNGQFWPCIAQCTVMIQLGAAGWKESSRNGIVLVVKTGFIRYLCNVYHFECVGFRS